MCSGNFFAFSGLLCCNDSIFVSNSIPSNLVDNIVEPIWRFHWLVSYLNIPKTVTISHVITNFPWLLGGQADICSSPENLCSVNVLYVWTLCKNYQDGPSLECWAFWSMDTKMCSAFSFVILILPHGSSTVCTQLVIICSICGRNLSMRSCTTSSRSWPSTYTVFW